MNHRPPPIDVSRSAGFTLLEIMIGIVVISIGVAALANLQGKLVRYSALAKQRTLAMNIAEQQIETMHSFFTMADTGAAACATVPSGFDDLQTCTSGVTRTAGNMEFTLSWDIESVKQNADGTTEQWSTQSGNMRPDLKMVTVTVEWDGGDSGTQRAELVDIVDGTPIFNTGRLGARVDSNIPPRTPYNPGDFPGVVEIAIGNQKLKGSTTPEPQIVNQGNNVITTFDVVTFLQSGSNSYLQRREEFKAVNCICTLDAGTGTGREPTVWNGEHYELGALVTKRTGSVSSSENGQPKECEDCCNDHHDAVSPTNEYDPFRPDFSGDAGDFDFLGDHAHYDIVNGAKVLAEEGDDYIEACRYIRRNGLFRLTTDLANENLDVVPATYPSNYNTDYSTSVVDFVTDFSGNIDHVAYPLTVPNGVYSSGAPGIFLGNAGVTKPAMARGIYVDYMPQDLLRKVLCIQDGGIGTHEDYCDLDEDPPWLEIIPFFDVDVTALANWNRGSIAIEVTNSPISDIDSASFSRGEISLAQSHFDVDTDVTAGIERSNSGLTDTNPVDPHDENEDSSAIDVTVNIGGTPPATGILVLGDINAGSNQINVETVRVRQDPPAVNCEIITIVQGNTTQKAYVCDLEENNGLATGSVTFTDYNALKVTGQSTQVLNRQVCPSGAAFSGMTVYDDGVMADPDQGVVGERTVFDFVNLGADATLDVTIVKQSANCP